MNIITKLKGLCYAFLILLSHSAFAEWTNINNNLSVTQSKAHYDRINKLFAVEVTATNTSNEDIEGPFRLLIDTATIPVSMEDGVTPDDIPYFIIDDLVLASGESLSVTAHFEQKRVRLNFTASLQHNPPNDTNNNGLPVINFEQDGTGTNFTWKVFENVDNPAITIVSNPDTSGINTSSAVAQFTARQSGAAWAGLESAHGDIGPITFDTTNSLLTIMVYKTVISDVGLKFAIGSGGAQGEIKVPNTLINQWEELTFDFTGHIGRVESIDIDQIIVFPDYNFARTQDNIVYFDNIKFSGTGDPDDGSGDGDSDGDSGEGNNDGDTDNENNGIELTINGDFETGDTSGWISYATDNNGSFSISNTQKKKGDFSGNLVANVPATGGVASFPVVKQANMAAGTITPNTPITISFDLYGSMEGVGGVVFAEFFSELTGGGVSKAEILGSGPVFPNATWTNHSFTTTTGNDVSGGVTLQLKADCGANAGCKIDAYFDNVSVTFESDTDSGGETGGGTGDGDSDGDTDPADEILTNGSFDNGTEGWNGGTVIAEGDNNVFTAEVAAPGNPWDVNLSQVMTIVPDATYVLSFKAKASVDRTIIAGLGLAHDPWTNVAETPLLTTQWQSFSYTLTTSGFGDDNSRVLFDMGSEAGTVYLDDISVTLQSGGSTGSGEGDGGSGNENDYEDTSTYFLEPPTDYVRPVVDPNDPSTFNITTYGAGNISDGINPNGFTCTYDYGHWIGSAGVTEPGVSGCDPVGLPTYRHPQVIGDIANDPTPTHKWWGSIPFHGEMAIGDPNQAAYITPDPIAARVSNKGVRVLGIPTGMRGDDGKFIYAIPDPFNEVFDGIAVSNSVFAELDAYLKDYSDCSVTVQWQSGNKPVMEATFVHDSPYIYFKAFRGQIVLKSKSADGGEKCTFYQQGNSLGVWTNVAGIRNDFLITGEGSTTFDDISSDVITVNNDSNEITLTLLPPNGATTPSNTTADFFADLARNVVRQVDIDYSVNRTDNSVTVSHSYLDGEGNSIETAAGMLPMAWKNSSQAVSGYKVRSARGIVKFSKTSAFSYQLPFVGVLPTLPSTVGDFDNQYLADLVTEYYNKGASQWNVNNDGNVANDTYWAGKSYGKMAEMVAIARTIGMNTEADAFTEWLKEELADWFTADTTGNLDTQKYFVYDQEWSTLLGMQESYGSHQSLNDHHFHYGYFVRAAAEICRVDKSWCGADQYGPMIDLLIRDYAAGKNDSMFPYLRNFDPANGFSWASGNANFVLGNNNESTSEAANSYGAIVLYGMIMGNDALIEKGMYLHASSTSAYWEYWNNIDRFRNESSNYPDRGNDYDNFPADYNRITTSIIWGTGSSFSTWFSGAYSHILGIQGLPLNPLVLHVGQYPDYMEEYVALGLTESSNGKPSGLGNDQWRDIWWNLWAMTDADASFADYQTMAPNYAPETGESKAHTYHWVKTWQGLGHLKTGSGELTANHPAAVAFDNYGKTTYIAYNFGNNPITVNYSDGQQLSVAANSFEIMTNGESSPPSDGDGNGNPDDGDGDDGGSGDNDGDTGSEGELLSNGTFDNGTEGWNGGTVIAEGDNNVFTAAVAAPGNPWDVNLSQVMTIVPDATYVLSFKAKASVGRTIIAGLGLAHDPWTNVAETPLLTTQWQTFSYTLTTSGFGDDNSRVLFDLGAEAGTVYLDDISVTFQTDGNTDGGSDDGGNTDGIEPSADWSMVWNDEFDGSTIDLSKWEHEVNCSGGGNNEKQCYTSNPENSFVENGHLKIVAKPEGGQALPYSSARLRTKYKGDWKYGRVEVRAKPPKGQGSFPAIWMLPTDDVYGGWPHSGEIDIFESVNLKTTNSQGVEEAEVHGHIWYGESWPNQANSGTHYGLQDETNPADGFHTYAIEWEEGEIRWYVDDVLYQTQLKSEVNIDSDGDANGLIHRGWFADYDNEAHWDNAPFDQRFHLGVNST